jgi:hypothetical protein
MCQFHTEIIASVINAGATIMIGIVVAYVSIKYNRNSQKMEQDRLSKELFMEFNKDMTISTIVCRELKKNVKVPHLFNLIQSQQ